MKAARSVELAAYNAFQPETSTTYKQKMRSLFQNLKIKNNEQLRTDVYSGTINPDKFGKHASNDNSG
jgi:transcription elongation factor S-II